MKQVLLPAIAHLIIHFLFIFDPINLKNGQKIPEKNFACQNHPAT